MPNVPPLSSVGVGSGATNEIGGFPTPVNLRIGNFLSVTLTNVDSDIRSQLQQVGNIKLILAGVPFAGLCRSVNWLTRDTAQLRFELAFDPTNRVQWAEVLKNSANTPLAIELKNDSELPCQPVNLIAMDPVRAFLAIGVLILFTYVFFFLVTRTEIIRDPASPVAGDSGKPTLVCGAMAWANKSDVKTAPAAPSTVGITPEIPATNAASLETDSRRSRKVLADEEKDTQARGRFSTLLWPFAFLAAAVAVSYLDAGKRSLTFLGTGGVGIVFLGCVLFWTCRHFKKYWDPTRNAAMELRAYSLARTQMAIWFFLIICCWAFLWLLTGASNTLTNTVLILMGIGAGTALGAEVQDAGKPTTIQNITQQIQNIQTKVLQQTALPLENQQLAVLKSQLARQSKSQGPATSGFFDDILTDSDGISFHRFQMFIWTLALSVVFVVEVCQHLSMPDFDATLLGLMGISSGTYLGFMMKEPHSSNQSTQST